MKPRAELTDQDNPPPQPRRARKVGITKTAAISSQDITSEAATPSAPRSVVEKIAVSFRPRNTGYFLFVLCHTSRKRLFRPRAATHTFHAARRPAQGNAAPASRREQRVATMAGAELAHDNQQ